MCVCVCLCVCVYVCVCVCVCVLGKHVHEAEKMWFNYFTKVHICYSPNMAGGGNEAIDNMKQCTTVTRTGIRPRVSMILKYRIQRANQCTIAAVKQCRDIIVYIYIYIYIYGQTVQKAL